ncbi:MAG: (Fe-S)-binding protein [Ruthenibacterium sp.]
MWTGILWAAAVCAGLGLLGSVVLVLASRFLAVPQDERVGRLQEALPGANCGACGYAGCRLCQGHCRGCAANKCVPGGDGGKGRAPL